MGALTDLWKSERGLVALADVCEVLRVSLVVDDPDFQLWQGDALEMLRGKQSLSLTREEIAAAKADAKAAQAEANLDLGDED